ncbi:DUF2278 family protein [Deinococcus yavapaiensis]|uniref:Uncharacterized protein DUF2278 n=1 Tax=Deinococcus yavapaiensis KR-236 TaxID=694435 RepID=A0A318S6L1_9DEIO|nr:DUF2278 family protein [Deinococcus yavapaiensis]PYE52064.1 uncharacterized protein DUF2278 [Deinococcus yavapaiensis KR-236]
MPLTQYGVLVGQLDHFERDAREQGQYGRYFHGHVFVRAQGVVHRCAVDVATPNGVGVYYRRPVGLSRARFQGVLTLGEGFHPLPSTPVSGALDYLRSPFLRASSFQALVPIGSNGTLAAGAIERALALLGLPFSAWVLSNGDNALNAMEATVAGAARVFVFGERFANPGGAQGVHDIHQNQGDPAGSRWWASNGIWQDGGIVVERTDGRLSAFLSRFATQATRTDDQGHPR